MSALEEATTGAAPADELVVVPGPPSAAALRRAAADARDAAARHLRGLQQPDGWWKGELETNVTMDAEDVLLRHFLGVLTPEVADAAGGWIASQQHEDGPWSTFFGGPGDLSTTVEAYLALRLAGHDPEAPHMQRASAWVRRHGGLGATRVFTRIWLAMLGAWDWERLPVLPPEIMLLPPSVPLNIYDFGCWARQTIVALTVVMAHRPSRPLPFAVEELRASAPAAPPAAPWSVAGAFEALDRLLHRYERLPRWVWPRTALRRTCLALAERWIIARQEADGCWGGIQPPIVYSVIALHLQGYALDHPVMRAAMDGIDGFVIDDERGRRIEACQSPVWDTALAVVALADAGAAPDDPALAAAARWLVDEEVTARGDWSVRRPDLAPGGWAFEFANDLYPDVDDTAEVVIALRRTADPAGAVAADRGVAWTLGMQCRDGGWGAFDVDNDSRWCAALPFCDFGEVTDYPSADVTAHVLEMLAGEDRPDPVAMRRATAWLLDQQEADGSWWGRWGTNFIYGTGAAVPALVRAGLDPADPRIRRAVAWLEDHQNDDGGWGEDMRSYVDEAWRGRGTSTASQTAWALLALVAAGEAASPAARAGIAWLLATQRSDGTWDEDHYTGTGFPWDFNINYHLYRLVFPVSALGRWVEAVGR